MKKLDVYMIRELIVPFLIGTFAVVLMFQANEYIALAKLFNLDNIPKKAVFQFILYLTPSYMNLTLPVGMALASSLAMSRIARESELTAFRAAGARVMRVIAPIAAFGVLVSIGNFYLVERVIPQATKAANRIGYTIGVLGMAPNVKTNAFLTLRQYAANFEFVERAGDDLRIRGVTLIEHPEPDVIALTSAKTAVYHNGQWSFHDAYFRLIKGLQVQIFHPTSDFVINESIVTGDLFAPPMAEEMTIPELLASIKDGKKVGSNTQDLQVKLHNKFGVPAACLIFAVIGPIFAIYFSRSGGFVGVFLSMVLVMVYYNAWVISTQILSKIPQMPAWLAAWLPNILFLIAGIFLIRRLE
jgi:lipopolysaccharide export system permease protein